MKRMIPVFLIAMATSVSAQSPGHPFDPARISASIDSFVIVTRVTGGAWRPVGGVVQTIAREKDAIRMAVEYHFEQSKQRVEMVMNDRTLAPLAHWETLARAGTGETRGEVMFRDGRARGAYILSKAVIDIALDSGVVDDDASTALLTTLPFNLGASYTFRTFASPGEGQTTNVKVASLDTVTVPAGRFESYRLVVMARDTSTVFVTRDEPRRVVLVRLGNGLQEMRLVNARR